MTAVSQSKHAILRARAEAMAARPNDLSSAEACLQVVEFTLAQERYGIETSHIREVYPVKDLTPVPCTPSFVVGIMNVRSRIITVIDIRVFFDLARCGLSDLNKVIVIESGDMAMGILAESVVGARGVPLIELQPSLPTLTGVRAEYLRGVTEKRLVVLDAVRILTDANLVVNEQVEK